MVKMDDASQTHGGLYQYELDAQASGSLIRASKRARRATAFCVDRRKLFTSWP